MNQNPTKSEQSEKQKSQSSISVHGGEPRVYPYDALTAPIAQTATYSFENTQELIDYMEGRTEREEYGRYGNPSVRLVERKAAALEGAEDAVAFSSGMAAVTSAIFALTKQDCHVILFSDCYRRTRQFIKTILSRFGVTHTLVSPGNLEEMEAAIQPNTRLIISEAPTNPYQNVVDLEALVQISKKHKIKTLIDSTFATPVNLRPYTFGVDVVVQSATKYLSGHNDVLGGIVAGSQAMVSLIRDLRHVLGAVLDPHAAYLIQRGMKTLQLRVEKQNSSALKLAQFLENHPKIKQVWYPGLASHPNHKTAKKIMSGFGGVVTFEVDAKLEEISKVIDACRIPKIAPSLGGVESLIEQPALMSYFELSPAEREEVGIKNGLVRYSVGIEDAQELIDDLSQALKVL